MTGREREKRWVVRAGDGATVGEIVQKASVAPSAFTEGRVFVGRRRASDPATSVKPGDEVRIGPASSTTAITILWEQDGLLACVKPAGLPTVPDHGGAAHSLLALAAAQTSRAITDLRVTSRLDREVSGVVVFALDAASEQRLVAARSAGLYHRRYVAIAKAPSLPRSVWNAPIGRGADPRHRAANGPAARPATTHVATAARAGAFSLLAVAPETGRTHQIRVHAAHAGTPLLGDRDYGGATRLTLPNGSVLALSRIALHAAMVTVPDHDGAPLVARAPIPPELERAWRDLGGAPEAWDMAVTCTLEP